MVAVVDPLLLDIPEQFETERLILRVPRPGDSAVIHEAVVESFEALRVWMPWAKTIQTRGETEGFVRRSVAEFVLREELTFGLFRKSDGAFVGNSGMHHIDWSVPKFEIGYWIRTSFQGQGYMTEAVNGIAAFAFDTLRAERLEIRCDSRNRRSAAVAERAGFTLDGHLRSDSIANDGTLRDTLIYGKIRGER
jgi:RimJ/RimL family protein N-acetyltransferase